MIPTRGFTKESGKDSRKGQIQSRKNDEKTSLERENQLIRNTMNHYKEKYEKTLHELNEFKEANLFLTNLYHQYPYLFKHLCSLNLLNENENAKYGHRFIDDVVPFYLLINTAGDYVSNILHRYFGFPCPKTCRNLKNKFKDRFGLNENTLDGSLESIQKLIQLFWKSDDKRCVIAVDAAAVKAKISIHKDGVVDGLLEDLKIDKSLVELYSQNEDEFYSFYQFYHDEIVKYYFVFYVCALNNNNKSFPIVIKKKTKGAADNDINEDLEVIIANCQDAGMEVVGISFDGDPSYLHFVENMCEEICIIDKLDLKQPLSKLFQSYKGVLIFEDALHLLKCSRYRLVCGSQICPSLSNDHKTFGIDDLKDIGIKEYLLDPSKSKKMDDNLPLLLFSQENIEKALLKKRYDIVLSMLPSYLLANSLFSTELNRNQRIEQLSFGCSIALIYYNDYINYNFEKGKQSRSRQGGTNQHMTLFDPIWLKKYISLTTSLVQVIREQKEVHLGSLGTHFLEHFFGMVRRFCRGNDCASSFEQAVDNIIVYKLLQKEKFTDLNIQPGRSDSGVRLRSDTKSIKEIPIDVCLYRAANLMQTVGSLINTNLYTVICESVGCSLDNENIIGYIHGTLLNKKKCFNSTSQLGYNSTSGYTSMKRIISGNSI